MAAAFVRVAVRQIFLLNGERNHRICGNGKTVLKGTVANRPLSFLGYHRTGASIMAELTAKFSTAYGRYGLVGEVDSRYLWYRD